MSPDSPVSPGYAAAGGSLPPAGPPLGPPVPVTYPVYPVPPMAFAPQRRQPERGLDGLLVAAWVLAMLGLAAAVVGLGLASVEFGAADPGSEDVELVAAGVLATIGGALILAGLIAGSVRSILLRRNLGEDRYRGPSLLALMAMWLVASNLAAIPFLDEILAGLAGEPTSATPLVITLLITPVTLLVVTIAFVLVPRALPGVRLLDRSVGAAIWSFVLGVLIGAPAWLVGTLIAYLVATVLAGLGVTPDSVLPMELLEAIPPLPLVVALVVAAPIAEELFFRAVLFSAWEREYGYWRALIGSSAIFALVHLSLFALAPILILAFVLGYVYARTRSLITVIGIHATFNAISAAIILFAPAPA